VQYKLVSCSVIFRAPSSVPGFPLYSYFKTAFVFCSSMPASASANIFIILWLDFGFTWIQIWRFGLSRCF